MYYFKPNLIDEQHVGSFSNVLRLAEQHMLNLGSINVGVIHLEHLHASISTFDYL